MNTTIDVIGVYDVEANAPVHLIEILVKNSNSIFDLAEITQEIPDQPRRNWQAPWDEKILDHAGKKIIADYFTAREKPELWIGNIRMAFFFHYLDFSRPLMTPFGPITLSNEGSKPNRLSEIEYESPN